MKWPVEAIGVVAQVKPADLLRPIDQTWTK